MTRDDGRARARWRRGALGAASALALALLALTPACKLLDDVAAFMREPVHQGIQVDIEERLSTDVVRALYAHRWPGNVRELKNVMDYAAAAAIDADVIEPWHLPDELSALAGEPALDPLPDDAAPAAPTPPSGDAPRFRPIDDEVAELERARMVQALVACDGVRNRAAALIQMPLRTFVTKFKRFAIQPSEWAKPRAR